MPRAGQGAIDQRPRVDAERVVLELGPVAQRDEALLRVEGGELALHELDLRAFGKARDVDLRLLRSVVPGDHAGKHARIHLQATGRDDHRRRAEERALRQRAQHGEMRVTRANHKDALHALSLASSRLRSSLR
jgi:hypothetical protein